MAFADWRQRDHLCTKFDDQSTRLECVIMSRLGLPLLLPLLLDAEQLPAQLQPQVTFAAISIPMSAFAGGLCRQEAGVF